jgi:periplasmic divalent cation tolerance protein
MTTTPLLVLCTCPDGTAADAIASALLEAKLAACVNRINGVESLYRWEGSIQRDQEVLLLIKTTAVAFGQVESAISDLHPYELPEIIGVPVTQGSAPYLDWLTKSVG